MLDSDYPVGEEVPQDLEANQGDRVSLAGSVASMGSTGSDGALAAEGTTAVPQTAGSGATEPAAEQGLVSGSGTKLKNQTGRCSPEIHGYFLFVNKVLYCGITKKIL